MFGFPLVLPLEELAYRIRNGFRMRHRQVMLSTLYSDQFARLWDELLDLRCVSVRYSTVIRAL